MQEVYDFLKKCETYFIATVDGDKPKLRPFGTVKLFEDKLYIQTGKSKAVSQQIGKNPNVAICAMSGEQWIRIETTLVNDDRVEPKAALLADYPRLQDMYSATDPNNQVLYMKDTTATICSFTSDPKVIKF